MSSKNKRFDFDLLSLGTLLDQWKQENIKAFPKHEEQIEITRAAILDLFNEHEGILMASPEPYTLSPQPIPQCC